MDNLAQPLDMKLRCDNERIFCSQVLSSLKNAARAAGVRVMVSEAIHVYISYI